MSKKQEPVLLTEEASRLTEKIFKRISSPTPRGSVYNRCLESLGWVQEKTQEAINSKWQEIYNTDVWCLKKERDSFSVEAGKLRAENARLRNAFRNALETITNTVSAPADEAAGICRRVAAECLAAIYQQQTKGIK